MKTPSFHFLLSIIASFLPSISFAADATPNYPGVSDDKIRNGSLTYTDMPGIILSVTNFLLYISGSVSMVVIIVGALKMQMGSGIFGSANKEGGKNAVTYGIVGLVISLSSWLIVNLIITNL